MRCCKKWTLMGRFGVQSGLVWSFGFTILNMAHSRHASTYVRFLNLVNALRQMPAVPLLDAVEERLLGRLLAAREAGQLVQVTEAARMEQGTPERTAFRRIKTLHSKGMLAFEPCVQDQRVRYIVPTRAAEAYFEKLGKCLELARESAWSPSDTETSKASQ